MSGSAGGPSDALRRETRPEAREGEALASVRKMEYWREMRNLIIHEDNLVNHRFSWLLTYEGFLMGGFFVLQSGLLSNKVQASGIIAAEIFLLLVMLASMWICFITGQTISAAYRQTSMVYHCWIKRYPEEDWQRSAVTPWFWPLTREGHGDKPTQIPADSDFPPLLGKFRYHSLGKTLRIPFILCIINLLAAAACVGIAGYASARPGRLYAQPATAVTTPASTSSAPATPGVPELRAPHAEQVRPPAH